MLLNSISNGSLEFLFSSEYRANITPVALPGYLNIRVELDAQSLRQAGHDAGDLTRSFLNVISLSTNAPIANAEIIYAVEITPGKRDREFYQSVSVFDEERPPLKTRLADFRACAELIDGIHGSPQSEQDLCFRVAQQYALALHNWHPDTLALAATHVAIGAETLARVHVERQLAVNPEARKAFNKKRSKGREARTFDGTILLNEVYYGNQLVCDSMTELSNAYEHGYGSYDDIKAKTNAAIDQALKSLRNALIEAIAVPLSTKNALLSAEFANPLNTWWAAAITGTLPGEPASDEAEVSPFERATLSIDGATEDAKTNSYALTTSVVTGAARRAVEDIKLIIGKT